MNRTPPVSIRRQLRQEVNFGCPIEGCGAPYLTYHHFDPPWREKEHHNPEGMIALCSNHAANADGGVWTNEQLKEIKHQPFIHKEQIEENFRFLRNDVICQLGPLSYGFKNFITISNERVLGFERTPEEYLGLNMLVRDREGSIILEMNQNDWIVYTNDVFDFECPPQSKWFRIRAKDDITNFTIRFDDYTIEDFMERTKEYKADKIKILLNHMGNPQEIHVLKIIGRLQMGKFDIRISENGIKADSMNTHVEFKNSIFIGTGRSSLFSFQ